MLSIALAGCSHSTDSPQEGGPVRTPGGPTSGSDAAFSATRALVLSKSTYDVTLKPQTKVVESPLMAKAYRGVAKDGALTFDAAAARGLATLAPGTVAIFAGVAMLRVTQVISADGKIAVTGEPVGLEDVINHGRIAWVAPLDFRKVTFNPPPGFHPIKEERGALLALVDALVSPAHAGLSLADNSWDGSIKGWKVTIKLTPDQGNLSMDVHASKSLAGGTLDVQGVAHIDGLTNEGTITLEDGETTQVTFDNQGLKGGIDFTWKAAFDAEHGGNSPELNEQTVENLPFSLDFPIVIGPIPFKLSFKTGFAFQPAFSSKVAVAEGTYHADFGGSTPMQAGEPAAPDAGTATDGSLSAAGSITSHGGTVSVAALGLSTTVAMPKIVFTIGLPSELDSFLQSPDFGGPWATFLTQANFIATGTLTMVQCEKRELKLLGLAGYAPGLLGKLKLKPVSKTLFEKTYTEVIPPNITLCQQ